MSEAEQKQFDLLIALGLYRSAVALAARAMLGADLAAKVLRK